jgi:transposase
VLFRMLFIGYFEGIDSQRGIAWRCSDSLSLRSFLGLKPTESSPDHSSLTIIRQRLPKELIEQVFSFVLTMAFEKKMLKGKAIGVDATTLEANAAMKSIVRRDGGGTWKEYLTRLAKEAGIENPTADQLRQFDRKRNGKKTSNDDWQSPSDPDARITKMKDGTTGLAYKAEHAVDLETEIVVAADVKPADAADGETVKDTVVDAQGNLNDATKNECVIAELAADKGYHKTETLVWLRERGIRSYVAVRRDQRQRRWDDKPDGWREAVYENRRRTNREKGRQLQRRRSEVVERSFAHVCATGGSRRTWIRGLAEVGKRYLVAVMAHNLGVILRALIGVGKPREWASMRALIASLRRFWSTIVALLFDALGLIVAATRSSGPSPFGGCATSVDSRKVATSTGC